ncbi:TIGR04211 family SH3 domain-containing protein [Desulfoluna spongiiphila]|uniref:SH3 domain protein n=1 Tax=Desulfoluna spongiiphila TaxID=419481 RepID=A0A1G5CZC1_9BACT|nr:TIGR04211 family SH3 domain-containing protein [Desulfoluna spongiiphila]SCY07591.1 SH3 domain protein [Desulfoluna spongiiphila]VVS92490.1 sh3 domain protein [Desulfoluna spongiiphila]
MKIKALVTACLLFSAAQAAAETLYITDRINATFRGGPGTQFSILRGLPSGTAVKVIEQGDKWTRVTVDGDVEGWVLTQWLVPTPTKGVLLDKLQVKHDRVLKARTELKGQLAELKKENSDLKTSLAETKKLAAESGQSYQQLKKKSGNFLQLEEDYKETKNQLANLSKKADILNDRLAKKNMIWFLAGAGVLLVGFIIGSSSRKKRSSYY